MINKYLKLIEDEIKRTKELKEKIENVSSIFSDPILKIRFSIATSVCETMESHSILLRESNNILALSAVTRNIFEALISAKYLNFEDGYLYKMYYNLIIRQEENVTKMIDVLKDEIDLTNDFDIKYEIIMDKYNQERLQVFKNKKINIETDKNDFMIKLVKKIQAEENNEIKRLDEEYRNNMLIFGEGFEGKGYSYHSYSLEKEILPKYNEFLNKIYSEKNKLNKLYAESEEINKCYPEIEFLESKVNKIMKKDENTFTKAKNVELENQYNSVFKMSSSIMHFSGYSSLTSKEISKEEWHLLVKQGYFYLKAINEEINKFTGSSKVICQDSPVIN